MNKLYKKNLLFVKALLVMLCVLIASPGFAFAAQAGTSTSDLSGHWAEKQIAQWAAKGLIAGYPDGTYQPDHSISRVEFVTFVNRALKFTGQAAVNFSDVPPGSWEAREISTALAAGYISGYQEDGTFRPNQVITRQEAASVLKRALKLEENADATAKFADAGLLDWSKGSVGALAEKGYLTGFADGTFRPFQSMTRAETVVMLDRVLGSKLIAMSYDEKGEYGPATGTQVIEGNVVISAPDVTLRNTIINGDLLIAASVGDGDVFLKGVTVKGTTDVQGGGENSIHFEDSVLLSIIVNRADGTVRIVAEGSTTVQSITLQSSSLVQASGGGSIEDVILSSLLPAGAETSLEGSFSNVQVQATSIRVNLAGGTIENLLVAAQAANSTLNLDATATVSSMVLDSATTVSGQGTVQQANVNANGSSFERRPGNVHTPPGVIIRDTIGNHDGNKDTGNNQQPSSYLVRGKITDIANHPVSGVTINFRHGALPSSGTIVASPVTDASGKYTVSLAPGAYTGDVVKEGFLTTYVFLTVNSNGQLVGADATAIRIPESEETRIVMYWGEHPTDLDSHLVGPTPEGTRFHTWYGGREYYYQSKKYADLDHDDVTSFGPETTTIRQEVNGTYRFYVHNFTGRHTGTPLMRASRATVEVYRGDSNTPAKVYQIPTGTEAEKYWAVFEMTVNDGQVSFTDINQFFNSEEEAKGSDTNSATVSSALYTVQHPFIIVPANDGIDVNDFKAGLTVSEGASFEVYESDGTTVRSGLVAEGDKVIVTAANGITRLTYTVKVEAAPTVAELLYEPQGGLFFYDLAPKQIVATALYSDQSRLDVTEESTFMSFDESIATVDENGLVTPVANGETLVKIYYGDHWVRVPVKVDLGGQPPLTVSRLLYQPQGNFVLTRADQPLKVVFTALYSDDSMQNVSALVKNEWNELCDLDEATNACSFVPEGTDSWEYDRRFTFGGQTVTLRFVQLMAPFVYADGSTLEVGNLIEGATVEVRDVTGNVVATATATRTPSQSGQLSAPHAQFTGLAPGTYFVTQTFSGYNSMASEQLTL